MMELNSLRTDPKTSVEGTWIDYLRGTALLIARYDNREMQNFKQRKAMEHGKLFTDAESNMDEVIRLSEEIEVECLARFVLRDWKGFTENGEELKYTPELGIKILSDESYEEFRDFVTRVSRNNENYRVESETVVAESVKAPAAS